MKRLPVYKALRKARVRSRLQRLREGDGVIIAGSVRGSRGVCDLAVIGQTRQRSLAGSRPVRTLPNCPCRRSRSMIPA